MGDIKALEVPKWGLAMEEGTIVNWLIAAGDSFNKGQEICEIETSKIVNVLESPFDGLLRRIVAEPGDTLPVGALIGVAAANKFSDADIAAFIRAHGTHVASAVESSVESQTHPQKQAPPAIAAEIPAMEAAHTSAKDDSTVAATPVARKLALELGVNLHDCQASGSRGRVSKADVEAAAALLDRGADLPPADISHPEQEFEALPMHAMHRTIASRLQSSKREAPHFRLTLDLELDRLLNLRQEINDVNPQVKISLNDLLLKACAQALVKTPGVNVQFDAATMTVRRFAHANIAVAVALKDGLITPIVRNANLKTLTEIATEMRDLVSRAKAGTLKPNEFQGGTFSISNLGMFGVKQFDAIINPPQAAILAIGSIESRCVVRNNAPAVARAMTVTLSADHRIIDGALGAKFMQALKRLVENPAVMIA